MSTTTDDRLREALAAAGFEPDFNVCSVCGHHGGEHDLGNWCLVCPRPETPARPIGARLAAGWCYFGSMTEDQKWEHGIAALRAALVAPVPDATLTEAIASLAAERMEHEETREALAALRTALGPIAYHAFDEHDECRWCGVEIEWDHESACPVPGAIVALALTEGSES